MVYVFSAVRVPLPCGGVRVTSASGLLSTEQSRVASSPDLNDASTVPEPPLNRGGSAVGQRGNMNG